MTNNEYGSWHAENEFQPHEGSGLNVSSNERLWSVGLGAFLLSSGLNKLTKNPIKGLVRTFLGSYLLYRGASGHCAVYGSLGKTKNVRHSTAINIRTGLIVNKPKDEVYAFWRKLENLPLFMKHLAAVSEIDSKHSHWEAVIPGNIGKIKWNAEIVKEEPGYLIGWQSIPNSTINNAGKVTFNDALGGQGTELEVVISYHPPAGEIGSAVAKSLNSVFEKLIRQDIMNFKDYIETKHRSTANTNNNPNILRSENESVRNVSSNSASMSAGTGSTAGPTENINDNPNILRSERESVEDGSGRVS